MISSENSIKKEGYFASYYQKNKDSYLQRQKMYRQNKKYEFCEVCHTDVKDMKPHIKSKKHAQALKIKELQDNIKEISKIINQ